MSAVIKYEAPNVNLAELNEMGSIFVKSGYFKDARDAAQAVVKIMYGRELGFSPVIAMSGIHIIEGKPSLSANLMGAMVKRSGRYDYKVRELTDNQCILDFTQNGQPCGDSVFTMADAKRAGVVRSGGSWDKYPRNMLFARALSNGVKMYCPDLSMCPIYNPEELGAEVNGEGEVISHPVAAPKVTGEVRTFGKVKAPEVPLPFVPAERAATDAPPTMTLEQQRELAKFNAEHPPVVTEEPKCGIEYAAKGEIANFCKEFRLSLTEELRPNAEVLRHEWLGIAGYVDKDGNPSATMIPKTEFIEARTKACAWAKGKK